MKSEIYLQSNTLKETIYNNFYCIILFPLILENLTTISPDVLVPVEPPPQFNEQGAAFGLSFDITEDGILLVGAATQENTLDGNPLINSGTVFSFKFKDCSWVLTQLLFNPDGVAANDCFGGVVKTYKNFALISNSSIFTDIRLNTNSSVYLYVFEMGRWRFLQKVQGDLVTTTPLISPVLGGSTTTPVQLAANFGGSIAFDSGWALIGAPFENLGSSDPKGAAYFYKLEKPCHHSDARLVFKQKVFSDDPRRTVHGL